MNKKAIEQLYQSYVQKGLLDPEIVDLETFSSMDYDQAQQAYKAGVESELFNVPFSDFSSTFGLEAPKKKKIRPYLQWVVLWNLQRLMMKPLNSKAIKR